MTDVKAVEIRAELRQIKTMVDGTVNITLNVPEYCKEQVKAMLDWLGNEVKVVIANDVNEMDQSETIEYRGRLK